MSKAEEKLSKAIKLADAMYYAAQQLSTDASHLKEAMKKWLNFKNAELKESEDEKIRQKFIKLVKMSSEVGGFALHKWEADEMLAWLEKQGEQKPQRMVSAEAKEALYDKPDWSDEDEEMCQETIDWFEKKCFPYAIGEENPAKDSINWLKSIKQKIKGE